jgi:hypothetical protein
VAICEKLFPTETKAKLQEMIQQKDIWVQVGATPLDAKQITDFKPDATHRLITQDSSVASAVKETYVQELQEDKNCQLFRLGLDVAKAQTAIDDITKEAEKPATPVEDIGGKEEEKP